MTPRPRAPRSGRRALLGATLIGAAIAGAGCRSPEPPPPQASPQEAILGTWKRADGRGEVKFTREGYRLPAAGFAVSCYTITADRITYTYGPTADNQSVTYPYTRDGNTLTVSAPEATIVLTRVSDEARLTDADMERVRANGLATCPPAP